MSTVVESRLFSVDNYRVFGAGVRFRSTGHPPSHLLVRWSQVQILLGMPQHLWRFDYDHLGP